MVAADDKTAVMFSLSPDQAGDTPRDLLNTMKNCGWEGTSVIMDKAYERDDTRQLVLVLGMIPAVPPKKNRVTVWEYNKEMYKKRNEVECLFRRLKNFQSF